MVLLNIRYYVQHTVLYVRTSTHTYICSGPSVLRGGVSFGLLFFPLHSYRVPKSRALFCEINRRNEKGMVGDKQAKAPEGPKRGILLGSGGRGTLVTHFLEPRNSDMQFLFMHYYRILQYCTVDYSTIPNTEEYLQYVYT